MNEAKQMHDDLLNVLLPIIPRTTYQDIRRLNPLVWAIVCLVLTQSMWSIRVGKMWFGVISSFFLQALVLV